MPEQWIDQHVGTEAEARQTFRAELRSTLRDAWDGEAVTMANVVASPKQPRRWIRGAVAGGLVAASVVAGLIVIRRDSSPTTVDTSPATIVESTTTVEVGSALREVVVDSRWAIIAVNDKVPTSHYVPWFKLSNDGVLGGDDGCNDYGVDLSSDSRWTMDGDTITPPTGMGSTAVLCTGDTFNPFSGQVMVSLVDRDTITLDADADADAVTYTAIRLDPEASVSASTVAGEWTWAGGNVTIEPTGRITGLDNGSGSAIEFFRYQADLLVVDGSFIFWLIKPPTVEPSIDVDLTIRKDQLQPISPQLVATIPWGTGDGQLSLMNGEFGIVAAALPDGQMLILDQPGSNTFTGRAVRSDGSTVTVEGIAALAGGWMDVSPNGTLFLALAGAAEGPHIAAFRLQGDPYVKVATSTSPLLGDSEISLTAGGVESGGRVLLEIATGISLRQPVVQWDRTSPQPSDGGARGTVLRTEPGGTERRWTIRADLDVDTLSIETRFWDLGSNVVVSGPSDNASHQQFIGLLSADGASQVFDSRGWRVIGTHRDRALLANVATDGLRIARFPAAPPLDLAQGAVYGVQPAMPAALAVETITAQLGNPDVDTDSNLFVGCGDSGDIPRRVVRWVDLTLVFARGTLLGWSVGDPRAGWSSADDPPLTAGVASDLRSVDGIGVGSSYSDLAAAYNTGGTGWSVEPIPGGTKHVGFGAVITTVIESDGRITGIGTSLPDC
jgi:heat shock protein HslJ